jgi:glycosyltransferase involved in cell wall biosynthesis
MKILYLTNHLNVGGVTSYILTLAAGMKNRGHKVYLASGGGELLSRFSQEGIIHKTVPLATKQEVSPAVLISAIRLLKYVKKENIDLIHANTRVTQVTAGLICRFSGKPNLSTCHGFFKRRLSRRLFPCWGLKVIAISQAVKEHLIEDFKVKEENISLIHNGIDVDKFRVPACPAGRQSSEFRAEKKKALGLGSGPVIGIIARLSDVKGHVYLIEAMKEVLREFPDARLLIVGDGKMKRDLAALVSRLEMERNVCFIPSVKETEDVLAAMDLFVMPSLAEGLGLSLIEAMAAGLAVVGSDIGGIKSLIKHGYNGLLVEPANPKQLSLAILELLKNRVKAGALGANARDFVRKNFSQDEMIRETEKLYLGIHAV